MRLLTHAGTTPARSNGAYLASCVGSMPSEQSVLKGEALLGGLAHRCAFVFCKAPPLIIRALVAT